MKPLLAVFEKMSGLKINFHKSEILRYGQAKEFEDEYRELFCFQWENTLLETSVSRCIIGTIVNDCEPNAQGILPNYT